MQWCVGLILALMIVIIVCATFFLLAYLLAWVKKNAKSNDCLNAKIHFISANRKVQVYQATQRERASQQDRKQTN